MSSDQVVASVKWAEQEMETIVRQLRDIGYVVTRVSVGETYDVDDRGAFARVRIEGYIDWDAVKERE